MCYWVGKWSFGCIAFDAMNAETVGRLDASGSLVYSLTWITETFVSVFSFEGAVFSFVGCKLKGFTRSCRECVLMVFGPNFFLILYSIKLLKVPIKTKKKLCYLKKKEHSK